MNAQEYAGLIEDHLNSCQFLEDPPHFTTKIKIFTHPFPDSFFWEDDVIRLKDDLCLKVEDSARFRGDAMFNRNFSYDLRHCTTGRLIWRICNHGTWKPVSEPCHVHVNPDNEDERLAFFEDSRTTIFPYVMHCLKNHYTGKPQDWEVK